MLQLDDQWWAPTYSLSGWDSLEQVTLYPLFQPFLEWVFEVVWHQSSFQGSCSYECFHIESPIQLSIVLFIHDFFPFLQTDFCGYWWSSEHHYCPSPYGSPFWGHFPDPKNHLLASPSQWLTGNKCLFAGERWWVHLSLLDNNFRSHTSDAVPDDGIKPAIVSSGPWIVPTSPLYWWGPRFFLPIG